MALDVLAQGRLVKTPEQRTGASGRPFALAQLSVAMEEGDVLASCIAFSRTAIDALLALDKGDACAVAGRAKVGTWTNREGETRPSLSITVDQVLTVYAIRKKRTASQGDDSGPDDSTPTPARDRAATASQTSRRPVLAGAGIAGMADDVPF
ncbi:MAG: single-stranded DNA-binding protein [Burkholderiales bacterium]|jgi:single-stranded DNA-binding protein|nr:single-stranded DNA-binding protein [Burkholderiales bacterium]